MAKFITGEELEKAVSDIIWGAAETLLIVSPYIKLDNYFKKLFDKHSNNPKVHLALVFGKNIGDVKRSMSSEDFEYFKKFLNISIVYVPSLHAKYYGNERKGVISSINLYDYSFKNNIEFGVLSETNLLNTFTTTTDKQAWQTCWRIAQENEAVFIKRPVYQKNLLSAILGKNYIKSDIIHDVTNKFYSTWPGNSRSEIKRIGDFPSELELGTDVGARPTRDQVENIDTGYCIRTGVKIPFNPEMPLSKQAYRSWAQFRNMNYPEKYCHKTGKPSNGKTSFRRPIL